MFSLHTHIPLEEIKSPCFTNITSLPQGKHILYVETKHHRLEFIDTLASLNTVTSVKTSSFASLKKAVTNCHFDILVLPRSLEKKVQAWLQSSHQVTPCMTIFYENPLPKSNLTLKSLTTTAAFIAKRCSLPKQNKLQWRSLQSKEVEIVTFIPKNSSVLVIALSKEDIERSMKDLLEEIKKSLFCYAELISSSKTYKKELLQWLEKKHTLLYVFAPYESRRKISPLLKTASYDKAIVCYYPSSRQEAWNLLHTTKTHLEERYFVQTFALAHKQNP